MNRQPLTEAIVAHLEGNLEHPISLGRIPKTGGWNGGAPMDDGSNFAPFVIVIPQTASASSGPVTDSQADWQMPYSLQSFGASPGQAEIMADHVRTTLTLMKKTSVDLDPSFKIQQVVTSVIGGLQRVDTAEYPFWGEADILTLWLAKERAP